MGQSTAVWVWGAAWSFIWLGQGEAQLNSMALHIDWGSGSMKEFSVSIRSGRARPRGFRR